MPKTPAPSRPINLYRMPSSKRAPAVFDRLDAIQEEVEALTKRRKRDADAEDRFRKSLRAICLDLYEAMRSDNDLCVGVSRSNSALSGNADLPSFVSARQFLAALNGLIEAEYVEQVSIGTEASGQTSRVKATQKLRKKLQMCISAPNDIADTRDPIRLRIGKPKKTMHFDDDEETVRWRSNLNRINANNARYFIDLDMTPANQVALEVERFAKAVELARTEREPLDYQRLNFERVSLYRVFNAKDWTAGGRFYGPWWQSVPREARRHITINGKHTCEQDFSALHLRLLYAMEKAPLPDVKDPYSLPYGEAHRSIVKTAFNVMLNSPKWPSHGTVPEFASAHLGISWRQFLNGIIAHHLPIAPHFNTGAGGWLQRADADIAEGIMLRFADMQQPCLPVHDSFITYASLEDELKTIMEEVASDFIGCSIPTKRTFRSEYSGPIGLVTDDIDTLLTELESRPRADG